MSDSSLKKNQSEDTEKKSGKILALDVGDKSIGCAIVGDDGIAPEPLPAIVRKHGALSLGPLRRLIETYRSSPSSGIHTLVVGLPLKNGKRSNFQSRKTRGYISKLKKHFPEMNLVVIDETLSTWSTGKHFSHLKLKKTTDPVNIDSFAARDILITYLNHRDNHNHGYI